MIVTIVEFILYVQTCRHFRYQIPRELADELRDNDPEPCEVCDALPHRKLLARGSNQISEERVVMVFDRNPALSFVKNLASASSRLLIQNPLLNFAKSTVGKLFAGFVRVMEAGNTSIRLHENRISGRGKGGIRREDSFAIKESRA